VEWFWEHTPISRLAELSGGRQQKRADYSYVGNGDELDRGSWEFKFLNIGDTGVA
jgi:hypothetical protein